MKPLRRLACLGALIAFITFLCGVPHSFGAETISNATAIEGQNLGTNSLDTNAIHGITAVATNSPPSSSACPQKVVDCGWVHWFTCLYFIFGTLAVLFYVYREMKRRTLIAPTSARDEMQNVRLSNLFFLPMFHIALCAVLLYLCCQTLGVILMYAVAWFSAGMLLGLIFSVPKSSGQRTSKSESAESSSTPNKAENLVEKEKKRRSSYETNNNLVEVSDWLTKIIVGLGLIHLKDSPAIVKKAVTPLKYCLGDCYLAFGTALILGFGALGFLFGYVFTRLFLARAFSDADPAEEVAEADQRLQERMKEAKDSISKSSSGTEESKSTSGEIGLTGQKIPDWQTPFWKLAEQYEQDRFPNIFQRVAHKDKMADEMAAVLNSAKPPKQEVADLIKRPKAEGSVNPCDGIIAGLASYVLAEPKLGDLGVLLSVALTAVRLHTRYRLIMAFRELLQGSCGTREQFEQVRVLIQGWLKNADDDLQSAILALEELIMRRYSLKG